jgi:hypothetical protein
VNGNGPTQKRVNTCTQCKIPIAVDEQFEHLVVVHLKKDLYRCPLCRYSSPTSFNAVERHIRNEHRTSCACAWPMQVLEEYQELLEAWDDFCFRQQQ